MRVTFVNENIGGHARLHRDLQVSLQDHPEVDARFVAVNPPGTLHRVFRRRVPGLDRLDLDLSPLRDRMAASVVARRRLGAITPETVVHVYTQSVGQALTGVLRSHPSVVGTDATLALSSRLLPFRPPTRFTPRVVALERRIEQRVFDAATFVVTKSDWAARSLLEEYQTDPERLRIVPYGILMPEPPAVAEADPPIITWMGRSLERKGGSLLLRLWRQHLSDHARLRIIGPVSLPAEPGLEVIDDLLLDQTERRNRLLAESAVFVFPSDMDTFGYAPIEAMAVGTPVVTYRANALGETVRDGLTGLVVESGDEEGLVSAIETILGDGRKRTSMGEAARLDVRARFDARVTTNALLEVFREAEVRHGVGP